MDKGKLVYVSDAVKYLRSLITTDDLYGMGVQQGIEHSINRLEEMDGVNIVHCKDCEHNPGYKAKAKNMVWCRQWKSYTPTTGFCVYGERRGDDERN